MKGFVLNGFEGAFINRKLERCNNKIAISISYQSDNCLRPCILERNISRQATFLGSDQAIVKKKVILILSMSIEWIRRWKTRIWFRKVISFIGCFIFLRDFEREELNISGRIIGIGIVSLKNPEVLQCYLPDIFISCP